MPDELGFPTYRGITSPSNINPQKKPLKTKLPIDQKAQGVGRKALRQENNNPPRKIKGTVKPGTEREKLKKPVKKITAAIGKENRPLNPYQPVHSKPMSMIRNEKNGLKVKVPGYNEKIVINEKQMETISKWEESVNKEQPFLSKRIKIGGLVRPLHIVWVDLQDGSKPHVETYLGFYKRKQSDLVYGKGSFKIVKGAVEIHTGEIKASASSWISKNTQTSKVLKAETQDFIRTETKREIAYEKYLHKTYPNIFPQVISFTYISRKKTEKIRTLVNVGRDLYALKDKLTPENRRSIAYQLADGLDAMHFLGLVHNDFKPGNVIAKRATPEQKKIHGGDFQVHPWDFGTIEKQGTPTAGTTHVYTAPEDAARVLGKQTKSNAKGDMWALGLTLFEVFSGKPPRDLFNSPKLESLKTKLDRIGKMNAEECYKYLGIDKLNISKQEKEILKMALHPDPEKRATADEIKKYIASTSTSSMKKP